MDKAFKLFFCMLLCASTAVVLSGCSDSNNSSTGNDLQEGPTNDAGYSTARQTVEGQMDNMLLTLSSGMDFTDGVDTTGMAKAYVDSFSYHSTSGWWVSYTTQDYSEYGYYYYYSDSLRFSHAGTAQQWPDTDTDKMEFKYHMGLESVEGSEYTYEFDFDCDWLFTGLDTDTLTLNGTGGYDYVLNYESENYSFDLSDTFTNVKVAIDDDYPHAGIWTETLTGYINTGSGFESASYTIRITFGETSYSAYISDGTYYWEWEEDYPSSISGYWAPPHP